MNVMTVDDYHAKIEFDPELDMFRGEILGLNGSADFAERTRRRKSMENVKSIEHAVESLPPLKLAEFRRWFAEFDGHAWDRQIEEDASTGKLDYLAAEARADLASHKW